LPNLRVFKHESKEKKGYGFLSLNKIRKANECCYKKKKERERRLYLKVSSSERKEISKVEKLKKKANVRKW